ACVDVDGADCSRARDGPTELAPRRRRLRAGADRCADDDGHRARPSGGDRRGGREGVPDVGTLRMVRPPPHRPDRDAAGGGGYRADARGVDHGGVHLRLRRMDRRPDSGHGHAGARDRVGGGALSRRAGRVRARCRGVRAGGPRQAGAGRHEGASRAVRRRLIAAGRAMMSARCVPDARRACPSIRTESPMSAHRIAVIPGDGIGKEVMPEGVRVLQAAARRFGLALQFDHFDFASCDYYAKHGAMMPDDWKARIGGHDAIYYGAVGWPATVPDHVSLWGSLLLFRREFDQYVNLRPGRLRPGGEANLGPGRRMPGGTRPLANREPGDIGFYVGGENTAGEYSSVGGKICAGRDREFVLQESIFTRTGVDRGLRYAFELARRRP